MAWDGFKNFPGNIQRKWIAGSQFSKIGGLTSVFRPCMALTTGNFLIFFI